ncbi:unnamed protein product [Rhizophagus irregularis]|nr:unnamed protein product [Rhizophagus irregularis]
MVEQYVWQTLPQYQNEKIDVNITVGTTPGAKTFPAHKSILNHIPYFNTLPSVPDNENKVPSVTIPESTPEIFEVIFRYLYTGALDPEKLKAKEIIEILKLANKLDCQELRTQI